MTTTSKLSCDNCHSPRTYCLYCGKPFELAVDEIAELTAVKAELFLERGHLQHERDVIECMRINAGKILKDLASEKAKVEKLREALKKITGPISGLQRYSIAVEALAEIGDSK